MNPSAMVPTSLGVDWHGNLPATHEDLERLQSAVDRTLPEEYLDLLRLNNGGEGALALPPLWLQLYDTGTVAAIAAQEPDPELRDYFVFATNGGLETIAFDARGPMPWPVVMFDAIAGVDSVEVIATSVSEFISAIGREATEAI